MIEEYKEIECALGGFCKVLISRLKYREKGVLVHEILIYKCSKCAKIFKRISPPNPLFKKNDNKQQQ